jgi:hypothetical protein
MKLLPIAQMDGSYVLVVVMEEENLKRIAERDPAEIKLDEMPGPWCGMRCTKVLIAFATQVEVEGMVGKTLKELWGELTRGWKHRPDLGDGLPIRREDDHAAAVEALKVVLEAKRKAGL